jgi:uncharacterized protein YdhG (YjbR/CyaY superfamily)
MADTPADIDAAIAKASPQAQPILREIRRRVQARLPQATEVIAYQMPAFKLKKVFFYFSAFKKHIGIYPPLNADSPLRDALAPYANAKGNLAFPLDQPVPFALIEALALALAQQYHPDQPLLGSPSESP